MSNFKVAGGDPSQRMFSIVKELLWRQRVIHPFPCDMEEVVWSLLPEKLPLTATDTVPLARVNEWQNLTKCLSTAHSVSIELNGQTGASFWVLLDKRVPAPKNHGGVFSMYSSSPYWHCISEWHKEAMGTHDKLSTYERELFAFFSRASHPTIVKKWWPEIFSFVDFKLLPNQVLSKKAETKRRLVPMPNQANKEGIIETLAGSTLLDPYKCRAWVGYETEE